MIYRSPTHSPSRKSIEIPRLSQDEAANLHRRHLTVSQRAVIADEMATRPWGYQSELSRDASTQAQAAKLMDVGEVTVARARRVAREAPELVDQIKRDGNTFLG
jgi:hypothetical protein